MNDDALERIVSERLDDFYERRIQKLAKLKLDDTLKRKNPYLFRAIGMEDATEIVERLLSAFTSSSDEGIFGDAFFEPLASAVSGGKPSPSEGVDIAIHDDDKYLAIAVKSGPSVFNAQSKKRQNQDFQALYSRLQKLQKHFDALVGYGYGRKDSPANDKKIFRELAGQAFWCELTGDEEFYLRILKVMATRPVEHKNAYQKEWTKAKNRFVREFSEKYCKENGEIDWEKILRMNSRRKKPRQEETSEHGESAQE